MKKFLIRTIFLFIGMVFIRSTGHAAANAKTAAVLTSFYPMQVFTLNVTQGLPELQPALLLPGTLGCPHDYALTPGDVAKLSQAQVLIMNGQMEQFLTAEKMRAINPKLHVIVSGQTVSDMPETESGQPPNAFNPHSWVSPFAAAKQARVIGAELSRIYPQCAKELQANAEVYAQRLEALGADMKQAIAALPQKKILTFHDAFAYFARDLGLTVVGVIELAPGSAPTPKHLQEMIALTKQHGLKAVFAEAQYPAAVAETIARATGAKVLVLDPVANAALETLTRYEEVMRKNLAVLQEALQ